MGLANTVWLVPGLLVTLAAGGAMDSSAATPVQHAAPVVTLVCVLSGRAKGQPDLDRDAVCGAFAKRIGSALGARMVHAATLPTASNARWVRVDLTLSAPGRIEAALTSRLHAKATKHPPLGVQVVDKSLGMREIDRLARLAAATLTER